VYIAEIRKSTLWRQPDKTISTSNFRGPPARLSQLHVGASIVGRAQTVFPWLHSAFCLAASAQQTATGENSRVGVRSRSDSTWALSNLAVSKALSGTVREHWKLCAEAKPNSKKLGQFIDG